MPEISIKYNSGNVTRRKINDQNDSFAVFSEVFDDDTIEYDETFFVVFLNTTLETIGYFKVSQGGISGTVVDPKKIFSVALQSGACGLIVAHNHPSGNITPSQADKDLTRKIKHGAETLDLRFLDHLIITKNNFYSFNANGLI